MNSFIIYMKTETILQIVTVIAILMIIAGYVYIDNSNAYDKRRQEAFYECVNPSKALYCIQTTSKTKYCSYDNYDCIITTDNTMKFQCQSLQTQDQYWFDVN